MEDNLELHHANKYSHDIIELYKYMTTQALYSFLTRGVLKITFPEDANDPFEFLSASEIPTQQTSEQGFISLSEEDDNPSLWGNYAEKYKGACVRFSIPFLTFDEKQQVNSAINSQQSLSSVMSCNGRQARIIGVRGDSDHPNVIFSGGGDILFKCLYRDKPFDNNISYNPPEGTPDIFLSVYNTLMKIYDKIAIKSEEWQHEKEHRIALGKKCSTCIICNEQKIYLSNRLTPFCSKIILAPFSLFTVQDVKRIMANSKPWKDKPVDVVKAEFQKGKYKLHIPD